MLGTPLETNIECCTRHEIATNTHDKSAAIQHAPTSSVFCNCVCTSAPSLQPSLSLSLWVCLHLCVSFSLQHKQSKKSNISFRPRIPLLCTQHMITLYPTHEPHSIKLGIEFLFLLGASLSTWYLLLKSMLKSSTWFLILGASSHGHVILLPKLFIILRSGLH